MGARLFAAVLPPEAVVAELDALLEPRRQAGRDVWRWTRPEGWHLTTVFMGSVAPRSLDRLVEGLAAVAGRTVPFGVGIGGALCFPAPDRTRVLALGVPEGHEPLATLARAARDAAAHAGADPDGARFTGHLTLARARRTFDATRWVHVVDSFPGWSWPVGELVLIESHLDDPGSRYEVLERFPFGGSALSVRGPSG